MNDIIPTPRTDAAVFDRVPDSREQDVNADFARTLERELATAQLTIEELKEDVEEIERHNLYTVEESLRASAAIVAAEGYENPTRVFASPHDRIWWIAANREIERLRFLLKMEGWTGP